MGGQRTKNGVWGRMLWRYQLAVIEDNYIWADMGAGDEALFALLIRNEVN